MSLPVYQDVVRKPNVMSNRNPLKQNKAKVVALADRIADLQNYKQWQKLIAEYKNQGIILDPRLRPLIKMVKLKFIFIDEDIQRALDAKHCTKIADINSFDPRYLQVIYCTKVPGKEEYHANDAQHTATLVGALIDAGVFLNEADWREVEMPVLYIETNNKAFARKAFALINGKGKKKISPWYEHRTKVLSVRIDKSTDADDVDAEAKQSICERHHCYPVDKESGFVGMAGTFTHMQALNMDNAILEMSCKFHNDYFHYDEINGALWFMIEDLYKAFGAAHIKITDKFLGELAGILQGYFAGIAQFHEAVHRAHTKWGIYTYGYEVSWQDEAIAAVLVLMYQKLGGTQQIPQPLLDRFAKILDFIDDDIKDLFVEAELETA
jgi:hypothetical protein